jgi:multiple sugar transport system substrate-binding protein
MPEHEDSLSRRSMLKGLAGAAAFASVPALATACGSSSKSSSPTTAAPAAGGSPTTAGSGPKVSGTVTFGSNYSDAQPKAALAAMVADFQSKNPGVNVAINTVDHGTFQNNISNYLQGTPDDVFAWFAGYRMQFFAAQGLASPIDDVWDKIGTGFSDAIKASSKGADGHYYFVPLYNYPWVVFYNKSTFAQKGYTVPTTWDDFVTLLKKAQSDGLVPLAFAEKDGWPALGTFDIINLRLNGYQFHVDLMAHKVPWTDPKVAAVFNQWAQILPYCQPGANGRIWQDAAKTLENKQAAMMFQGTGQIAANYTPANLADLDFFVYPAINTENGQDSMDAPTDGFMLSKSPKNKAAAKALLEYIGTPAAENAYLKTDPSNVATNSGADTSGYNAIQKKSVQVIGAAKHLAQFMDRDSRPDFVSTAAIPAIQHFIDHHSSSDISSMLKSLEQQAKALFTS